MIRKIMSESERLEKEKRNKRIAGIVLGIIMLMSTAGYFVFDFSGSQAKTIEYAGVKFVQNQYGTWDFSYAGNSYQVAYLPEQTKNLSVSITKTISDYYNKPLYISANPIEDISQGVMAEIIKNIGNHIQRANFACLTENCSQDYPTRSCSEDTMIVFEKSPNNQSRISQDDKCVVISYVSGEEERTADAFLYKIIGIE